MGTTGRMHLSHRTFASLVGAGLTASLAVGAPASAHPHPDGERDGGPVPTSPTQGRKADNLIGFRTCDDGVKGTVKNLTPHTVRIIAPQQGSEGTYVVLPPFGELTFYDCRKQHNTRGRDILYSGKGIDLTVQRVVGGYNQSLALCDPWVGRPDTHFTWLNVDTLRTGWKEGDSHHEITRDTSTWIKREKDGWDGGHETTETADWPVYSINIDRV